MPHTSQPAAPATAERQPPNPELTVGYRFRGPADSANGGYICGRVAGYHDGPLTVTLRRPPPLATPMTVDPDGTGGVRVRHGGTLIAEAAAAREVPPPVPDTVSMAEARAASGGARYFRDPVFPDCFVCARVAGPATACGSFPDR